MSTRIYYLRDQVNIRTKPDGSSSRGNPICCIISELDPNAKTLKYAYSAVHPAEITMTKSRSREVATIRLGMKPTVIENVDVKTNHDLNRLIIQDLIKMGEEKFSKTKRFIQAAKEWMKSSKEEDRKRQEVATDLEALVAS